MKWSFAGHPFGCRRLGGAGHGCRGSTPATSVFNSDVRIADVKQVAVTSPSGQGGSCARSHQADSNSDSCENKKEVPGSDNKEKSPASGGDKPDKWFDACLTITTFHYLSQQKSELLSEARLKPQ